MVDSALKRRFSKKQMGGGTPVNIMKRVQEKGLFLIAVFANLLVQLGITYFVMENYDKLTGTKTASKSQKGKVPVRSPTFFIIVIVQFIIIFMLAWISMPSWIKFLLFSLFSGLWGYLFSVLNIDQNLVHMAIFGAMSIFATMMVVGGGLFATGIQLGIQFGLFLFYALLILIIVSVVLMFTATYSHYIKAISAISLIIFSIFIVYDTNKILQREYYGDFITASMDYYLDILNIFLDLVNLGQQ